MYPSNKPQCLTKGPASALVLHLQSLPNELSLSFFLSLSAFLSTYTCIQHAQTAVQLQYQKRKQYYSSIFLFKYSFTRKLSFVHDLYAGHMTHCLIAHLILSKHMIIGQTDPPIMKEESQNTITDHMIWILFLYLYAFKHLMYCK